jgi:glycosyltransferase involved in cell wall biosynthesis
VKILYVSQYFPPEGAAPAARVAELGRHWVRAGHQVTVLTGFPNYPTGKLHPEYRGKLRRMTVREDHGGISVVRTWHLPQPNRSSAGRVINYGTFWLSSSLRGLKLERPDVLIATSPPPLVALAGAWLARRHHCPFVFEVRDLWPESLQAVGFTGLSRWVAGLARFLYRRADHVVAVSPGFCAPMQQDWKVAPERMSVVENGVEADRFTPEGGDGDVRREFELDGRFVVSYIGTVGLAHGLGTVLDSAERLQQTLPSAVLLIVGDGADRERLQVEAQRRGLSNVRFSGLQPRERIPAFIRASDACLVLLKRSALFRTVIPSKMLEFMACARPVIVGVEGQARKMVQESSAGVFIEPENTAELVDAVVSLQRSPETCRQYGAAGRRYVLANYSRSVMAAKYLDVLRGLVGEPRVEAVHA